MSKPRFCGHYQCRGTLSYELSIHFFGWIDTKKARNATSVCRSNFQERYETVHNNRPLERFLKLTRAALLTIGGKCSCLRAKAAHFPGHLPPDSFTSMARAKPCAPSGFLLMPARPWP